MPEPILLVADKHQKIYDLPGFLACGQAGDTAQVLPWEDLIPLPTGSNLFCLPDRYPIAFSMQKSGYEGLLDCYPVAAFVPPGYTQTFSAAYGERKGAGPLPLF
jgi:hypothetical protein